jgi:hypothetical protein
MNGSFRCPNYQVSLDVEVLIVSTKDLWQPWRERWGERTMTAILTQIWIRGWAFALSGRYKLEQPHK